MSVTNVLFVGLQKPIGMAIEEPTTVEQLKELMFPDQVRIVSTSTVLLLLHLPIYHSSQSDALYLCRGGCPLSDNDVITPSCDVLVLSAHFRLCGGKGGAYVCDSVTVWDEAVTELVVCRVWVTDSSDGLAQKQEC